jgi:hypothetical protein
MKYCITDNYSKLYAYQSCVETYTQCLDAFLAVFQEGNNNTNDGRPIDAALSDVELTTISNILYHRSDFRDAVKSAQRLLSEIRCVRFVGGENVASSRGRRRMDQRAMRTENLRNAAASLLRNDDKERIAEDILINTLPRSRSKTWEETTKASNVTAKATHNLQSSSRPRLIHRRALTSDEERDRYTALAMEIAPAEAMLVAALERFSVPKSDALNDHDDVYNWLTSPANDFDLSPPLADAVDLQRNSIPRAWLDEKKEGPLLDTWIEKESPRPMPWDAGIFKIDPSLLSPSWSSSSTNSSILGMMISM